MTPSQPGLGLFARWVRHLFTRRCRHLNRDVVADILDGDFHGGPGGDQQVQWCRRCGAARRVFDAWGIRPRYGDWRIPDA